MDEWDAEHVTAMAAAALRLAALAAARAGVTNGVIVSCVDGAISRETRDSIRDAVCDEARRAADGARTMAEV